jgi:hypothetical protein
MAFAQFIMIPAKVTFKPKELKICFCDRSKNENENENETINHKNIKIL